MDLGDKTTFTTKWVYLINRGLSPSKNFLGGHHPSVLDATSITTATVCYVEAEIAFGDCLLLTGVIGHMKLFTLLLFFYLL